ncbi:MAG TPA: VCBS repeat-containing protein, partial [Flavobacteriales bacterium]|nr:VCBS repeat-containing protein [Flavobacteriales bacterium]
MKNTHTLMHGIKLYRRYVRKYNRLKAIHAPLAKLEFLKKRILKLQHCLCSVLKPKNIAVTGCMMTASALTAQNYDNAISYPFGMAVLPGTYTCPAVADIDNDGDVDVFTGESGGNFAYWQNTGTLTAPAFGSPVGNPFGLTNIGYYSKPVFADLDNDGDQDMMSGETYGDFYYFQNTGTASAPAFAAPVTNPFGLSNAGYYTTPAFVDLDNDGDLDMLSGLEDGSLIYYQNTGTVSAPAFAAGITNPFGLSMGPSVYDSKPAFADLDGDGDQDMLSGDQYGDFYYFLNTGTATAPA